MVTDTATALPGYVPENGRAPLSGTAADNAETSSSDESSDLAARPFSGIPPRNPSFGGRSTEVWSTLVDLTRVAIADMRQAVGLFVIVRLQKLLEIMLAWTGMAGRQQARPAGIGKASPARSARKVRGPDPALRLESFVGVRERATRLPQLVGDRCARTGPLLVPC